MSTAMSVIGECWRRKNMQASAVGWVEGNGSKGVGMWDEENQED